MNSAAASMAEGIQVLTSPGPAGIAVVRLYGPGAGAFARRHLRLRRPLDAAALRAGRVLRATLVDVDGAALDEALVSIHADAPDWDFRLHLHGNPHLVRRCVALAESCGLRGRPPGPTQLWPHADILDAEAAAALPAMATWEGVTWLLAQPGRLRREIERLGTVPDVEPVRAACRALADRRAVFEWFARPLQIVVAGPPNAGKSTLVNALADQTVCVVSSRPGTTRDWVDVPSELDGFPVLWIDTAGVYESSDILDREAMARTAERVAGADAVVVVVDAGDPLAAGAFAAAHPGLAPACVAVNKAEICAAPAEVLARLPAGWAEQARVISAVQIMGIDALCDRLVASLKRPAAQRNAPAAWTARQVALLEAAARQSDRKSMQDKLLRLISEPVDGRHPGGEDLLPRNPDEG